MNVAFRPLPRKPCSRQFLKSNRRSTILLLGQSFCSIGSMATDKALRKSVLMIAGAAYTDRLLPTFTKELRGSSGGRFECSLLGNSADLETSCGEANPFATCRSFPSPATTNGVGSWGLDLVRCIGSPTVVAAGANLILGRGTTEFRRAIRKNLYDCTYSRKIAPLAAGFDLYHWHCMHWDRLAAARYLPRGAKLIITIWGSDLLRCAGIEKYRIQFQACRQASVITVASIELREVMLAKFGRDLAGKVRLVSYGADYVDVNYAKMGDRTSFLRNLGLPPDRIVVTVGHSGHRQNQQFQVLRVLQQMRPEILDKVAILLPMTYGLQPEYKTEVLAAAGSLGVPIRILDFFLSNEDVRLLRGVTDIFVHVPISDQFSAAMCESLAAGSVLVTGAWLPYRRLRFSGVHYHEVVDLDQLASTLDQIVARLPDEKLKAQANAEPIRRLMSWSSVMPRWIQIYDELLAG